MKQRNGAFSLLGAVAFSTFSFPAFANTATEQIGTQSATINGNNNQIIQIINQISIDRRGQGSGNNNRRGTVQDIDQGATINGSGNSVYQESTQVNRQESTRPGQRNGQARHDDDDDDDRGRGHSRGHGDDDDDDD
jgi:hypothetical protein